MALAASAVAPAPAVKIPADPALRQCPRPSVGRDRDSRFGDHPRRVRWSWPEPTAEAVCGSHHSQRRPAADAAAPRTTSARACAPCATRAAPSDQAPAKAASRGASTRGTTGPAGRVAGGALTTPKDLRLLRPPRADRQLRCLQAVRPASQIIQEPGRALDYAAANQHSQQLFLANMLFKRRVTPRLAPDPRAPARIPRPQADRPRSSCR